MKPGIYYRGECTYDTVDAVNISSLLWIAKSPRHYRCSPRKNTKPMSLGTAAHSATLEPERFEFDFAAWDRRGESGKLCPRNGKYWDAFRELHSAQTIITEDERLEALEISNAVRADEQCAEILSEGAAEVTLVWVHERTGLLCKGRVDWLGLERNRFADLKTANDISPGPFLSKSAKLHYHTRMAWYHDAIRQVCGIPENRQLETLIMAVESGKPHDCAVYWMDEEVLETGRLEYENLMSELRMAIDFDRWPGIARNARIRYTLPRWAVEDPEDESDPDIEWSNDNDGARTQEASGF